MATVKIVVEFKIEYAGDVSENEVDVASAIQNPDHIQSVDIEVKK